MVSISVPSPYIGRVATLPQILTSAVQALQSPQLTQLPDWAQRALKDGRVGEKEKALKLLSIFEAEAVRQKALRLLEEYGASEYLSPVYVERLNTPLVWGEGVWRERTVLSSAVKALAVIARDMDEAEALRSQPQRPARSQNRRKKVKAATA